MELSSAGKPLRFEVLFRVAARGVQLAHLTHEAGLSSTGDAALDAHLPVSERYELSPENAVRARVTQAQGGRVIAVGTSVTRALEAASRSGKLRAGARRTDLRLGPSSVLRVCDGLVTGIHAPGTSHFALLEAFARASRLERSFRHAERAGYLQHEFGDSCLILKGSLAACGVGSGAPRVPEWRLAG